MCTIASKLRQTFERPSDFLFFFLDNCRRCHSHHRVVIAQLNSDIAQLPTMENTFVKVLNTDEVHHGYKFRPGRNPLDRAFDDEAPGDSCTPNGLYFTQAKYVHLYASHGDHLRKVTLPPDAKFKHGTTKSRADVIELSEESWHLFSMATCKVFTINPVLLWCTLSDADPLRPQFWMDIWTAQTTFSQEDNEALLKMIPWAIRNERMEIMEAALQPISPPIIGGVQNSADQVPVRVFHETLKIVVEHLWSETGEFEMNVLGRLSKFINSIGFGTELKDKLLRITIYDAVLGGHRRTADQFHAIVKCIPGDNVKRNLWEHYLQKDYLAKSNACHLIAWIGAAQLYEWMLEAVQIQATEKQQIVVVNAPDHVTKHEEPDYDTPESVEAQIEKWISIGRGNRNQQIITIKNLLQVIDCTFGSQNKSRVACHLFKFIVATGAAQGLSPKFTLALRRKYLELLDNPKCDSWIGDFRMLLDVCPPELYSQIVARTHEDDLVMLRSFCEQHQIPCTTNRIESVVQSEPRSMTLRAQRDYLDPVKVAHIGWKIIQPFNNDVRQLCLVGGTPQECDRHSEQRWCIIIASGEDIASLTTDEVTQWPLLLNSLAFVGEDYREVLM